MTPQVQAALEALLGPGKTLTQEQIDAIDPYLTDPESAVYRNDVEATQ